MRRGFVGRVDSCRVYDGGGVDGDVYTLYFSLRLTRSRILQMMIFMDLLSG